MILYRQPRRTPFSQYTKPWIKGQPFLYENDVSRRSSLANGLRTRLQPFVVIHFPHCSQESKTALSCFSFHCAVADDHPSHGVEFVAPICRIQRKCDERPAQKEACSV